MPDVAPKGRAVDRIAGYVIAGFFCLVGLVFAYVAGSFYLSERSEERQLAATGRSVDGVIVRKYIEAEVRRELPRERIYRLRYRFAPAGEAELSGTAAVEEAAFARAQVGGRIAVRYLPGASSVHRIEGQVLEPLSFPGFALISAASLAAGGAMLYLFLRPARPARAGRASRPGVIARIFGVLTETPMLFVGVVLLAVGGPFLIVGLLLAASHRAMDAAYESDAGRTRATVIEKTVTGLKARSGPTHSVVFEYRARSGEEIVASSTLRKELWATLPDQGTFDVLYLPQTPWLFRIGPGSSPIGPYVLLGIGIFGIMAGAAAVAYGTWHRRNKRRPA